MRDRELSWKHCLHWQLSRSQTKGYFSFWSEFFCKINTFRNDVMFLIALDFLTKLSWGAVAADACTLKNRRVCWVHAWRRILKTRFLILFWKWQLTRPKAEQQLIKLWCERPFLCVMCYQKWSRSKWWGLEYQLTDQVFKLVQSRLIELTPS